jgi:hypothetical protein
MVEHHAIARTPARRTGEFRVRTSRLKRYERQARERDQEGAAIEERTIEHLLMVEERKHLVNAAAFGGTNFQATFIIRTSADSQERKKGPRTFVAGPWLFFVR